MSTTADPFKIAISEHLKQIASKDNLFAETLKKPNKSIDGCIKYIYAEVRKTKRCGFLDDEIYTMAIHYYDEDSIEEVKEIQHPKVSHLSEPKKENPKMESYKKTIQDSLKKPEKRAKTVSKSQNPQVIQISLF